MPSLGDAYAAAHLETGGMERDVDQVSAQLRQVAEQWERILNISGRVSADTKEADSEIKAMAREWEATLRDIRANVTVNVDLGDSVAKLESVQSLVEGLDGRTVSVKAELDDGGAQADLATIAAEADALDGTSISIRANVDLADNGITAQLEAQAAEWQRVADTVTVRPGFDGSPVTAKLEAAAVAWDQMADQVTVNPGFDPDRTIAAIGTVRPVLEQLLHLDATVNVDGLGEASSELSALEGELSAIGATSTNITVGAEVRQAVEELLAVAETAHAVGTIDPRITVDADTAKADAEIRTLTAARPPPIDIGVHLDQAQFASTQAQLAELKALVEAICVDCTINIDVDTNSINAGLAQIQATMAETLGSAPIGDLGDGFDNVGRSASGAADDVDRIGASAENAGRKAGRSEGFLARLRRGWSAFKGDQTAGIGDIDAALGDVGRTADHIDLAETLSIPDSTIRDLGQVGEVFDTIGRNADNARRSIDNASRAATNAARSGPSVADLGFDPLTADANDPRLAAFLSGSDIAGVDPSRRSGRPRSSLFDTQASLFDAEKQRLDDMVAKLFSRDNKTGQLSNNTGRFLDRLGIDPAQEDFVKNLERQIRRINATTRDSPVAKDLQKIVDQAKKLERIRPNTRISDVLEGIKRSSRGATEGIGDLVRETRVWQDKLAADDRAAAINSGPFKAIRRMRARFSEIKSPIAEMRRIEEERRLAQEAQKPFTPFGELGPGPDPLLEALARARPDRPTDGGRGQGGFIDFSKLFNADEWKRGFERIRNDFRSIFKGNATKVDLDTTSALAKARLLGGEIDSLLGAISVDVELNSAAALGDAETVQAALERISGTVGIDVDLNTAGALTDMATFSALLERLGGTVDIDVDVHTAAALLHMAGFKTAAERLAGSIDVDVDVKTGGALAHLAVFKGVVGRLFGGGGGGRGQGGFIDIGSIFGGLASSLGSMMGPLVSQLGAIGTSISSMTSGIGGFVNQAGEGFMSLAASAGPLIAKFALIAALIAVIVTALTSLVAAAAGVLALAAAFTTLSVAVGGAAVAAGGLGIFLNKDLLQQAKDGLTQLKDSVASVTRGAASDLIANYQQPFINVLTRIAAAAAQLTSTFIGPVADAALGWLNTFNELLSSPAGAQFTATLGAAIAKVVNLFTTYLPPYLELVNQIFGASSGFIDLLDSILQIGLASGPLWIAIGNAVSAFGDNLVRVAGTALPMVESLLNGLSAFFSSGYFIEFVNFVNTAIVAVGELFNAFAGGLDVFGDGSGLQLFVSALKSALFWMQALKPVFWALGALTTFVNGAFVAVTWAFIKFGQFLAHIGTGIGQIFTLILGGLVEIAKGAGTVWDYLTPGEGSNRLTDWANKTSGTLHGFMDTLHQTHDSLDSGADSITDGLFSTSTSMADFAGNIGGANDATQQFASSVSTASNTLQGLGVSMENAAASGTQFAQTLSDQASLVGAVASRFQQTIGLISKMRETASKPLKIKTDFSVLNHDIGKLIEFNDAASTAASTATASRDAVPGTPFNPPIESQANFVARKKAGQLDDRSGEKGVAGTAAAGLANDIQQSTTKTLVRGFTQAIAEADKQADEIVRRATYVTQLRAHGLYDLAEEVGKLEGEALKNAMAEIGDAAGRHAKELENRIDAMTAKLANSDANPLVQGLTQLADDTLVQIKQLNFTKELEEQGKANVAAWLAGLEGDDAAGAVKMIEAMTGGTNNAILGDAEKKLSDLRTMLEAVAFEQDPIGNMWFALAKTPGAKLGPEGWAALGVDNLDLQIAAGWTQALTNPFANKKPGDGVKGGTNTPHPMFDQATAGLTQKGKPISQVLKEGGVSESFTFTDTWGNVWRYVPPPGDASKPGKFVLVTVAEVTAPRENTATNLKSQMVDRVIKWAEQGLAGNQGAEQQKWAKLLTDPAAKAVNAAEREIAALAIARRQGRNTGSEQFQMGFDSAKAVGDGATAGFTASNAADVAKETSATVVNAYTDGITNVSSSNAAQLNSAGVAIAEQVVAGLSQFNFTEVYTVAETLVYNFTVGIHKSAVQWSPSIMAGGAKITQFIVDGIGQGAIDGASEQVAVAMGSLVVSTVDLLNNSALMVAPTVFAVGRALVMPVVDGMNDVSGKEAQNAGAGFIINTIAGVSLVVDLGKSELGRIGSILAAGFGDGVKWGIEIGTPPAVDAVSVFIATLGDTASSLGELQKETLGAVGRSMAMAVIDGIKAVSGKEASATSKAFMDQVKAGFTGTATISPTTPESRQQGARGGFFAGTEKAANAATQQAGKSSQVTGPGVGIGNAIADGIIAGMIARTPDIEKAAVGIANRIAQIMRFTMGIKSPSKVTTKIGQQMGEGLAIGLHSTADAAERAAVSVAERAGKAMQRSAGNHMDLNAIWRGEAMGGGSMGGGSTGGGSTGGGSTGGGSIPRRRSSTGGGSSKAAGPSQADLIKFYGAIASRHDELLANLGKVGIAYDQIRQNQGELPQAAAEIAMQVFQLEQAMGKMPPALQGAVEAARTKLDTTKGIVRDVSVTPTGERISDQSLTQFFTAVFDRRNDLLSTLSDQGVTRDMVVNNTGTLTTQQGQIGMQVLQLEQAMASIPASIRELLAKQGRMIDPSGQFVDSAATSTAALTAPPAGASLTGSQAAFVAAKQAGLVAQTSDGPLINIEKVEVVSPSPEQVPGQLFEKVGNEAWRLGWN